MMPPPPGMRGPMRIGGGPRGFLTDEEKQNKPKLTKALLKRIFGYLSPYKLQFIAVFAALAVSAVLGLFPSIITGKIVDAIVDDSADVKTLLGLVVLAFIVLSAAQIISVLEQYINSWISQKIIYDMRNQMYDHLLHMPHGFFTNEKQGDIITRMNSDINGVSSVISGMLASVFSNVLTVATCVFYLFYTDWRLAIVGLIVLPLLILPTKAVGRKRWELVSEAQEKQDELNQQVDETLSVSGSMLVKLFTKEKTEYEKFRKINDETTKITIREQRAGSWFRVFLGMFIQIAPLLIYFVGGFLIISHTDSSLTVGDISVVVALVNRLYQPVRQLLDLEVDFVRSMALFTRIFEYFDRKCNIEDPENPVTPPLDDSKIEFSDVHFSYENGHEILKGVNFTVPSGAMYAIVGTSGAGKSTIIGMIPRLYDVSRGSVKIAGTDVRDFSLAYLRQNIGIVTQDTYLFDSCFSFQGKFFHFLTINRHRKIEYDLLYPASVFPFLREHLNSLDKGLHKLLLLRFRCGMVDFIKCQQQAIDIVSGNLLLLDAADLTLQFANLNFDFLYGVILLIIAALQVQNLSVIVGIIDVQGIHLTLQAAFRSKGLL